ncbi:MAG: hypothetical protein ABS35_30060 [Kaistia sp. SCN 65-12]|nr:MAG: hypothetical protein ABS35_30060 [Kaistia sp. SCN 65-12]
MNGNPAFLFRMPALAALALLLAGDALGGPLRYGLAQSGLLAIAYLPILVAALVVCGYAAAQGACLRADRTAIAIGLVVAFYLPYALWLGRAPLQVAFGTYTFMPLFLGMVTVATGGSGAALVLVAALWWGAVPGVLASAVIDLPWVGASYEILGVKAQFARAWSAFGHQRLPGLSRASFTAANQIAAACALLLVGRFAFRAKVGIWGLSLAAVWLTTSKAPLVAVAVLPLAILLHDRAARSTEARHRGDQWVLAGLLFVVVALPLAAWLGLRIPAMGHLGFLSLGSLGLRMVSMWPGALALLDPPWPRLFLGLGFGGIGSGQAYFDPARYSAADNLFVFLLVTFGLASLLLVAVVLRGNRELAFRAPALARRFHVVAVVVLIIGMMSNVVESVVPALLLGMLAGKALDPWAVTAEAAPLRLQAARAGPAAPLAVRV